MYCKWSFFPVSWLHPFIMFDFFPYGGFSKSFFRQLELSRYSLLQFAHVFIDLVIGKMGVDSWTLQSQCPISSRTVSSGTPCERVITEA